MGRSANVEADGDRVTFVETFCLAHAGLDGDDVAAILGPQGGLPAGLADLNVNGDHAPTIGDEPEYVLQVAGLLLGDGDEVPGRRALPDPDLAAELDRHFKRPLRRACQLRGIKLRT